MFKPTPLEEIVATAQQELSNVYTQANFISRTADELIEKIPLLFDSIAHGSPDYREWLKKAIECHFLGEEMPEYTK